MVHQILLYLLFLAKVHALPVQDEPSAINKRPNFSLGAIEISTEEQPVSEPATVPSLGTPAASNCGANRRCGNVEELTQAGGVDVNRELMKRPIVGFGDILQVSTNKPTNNQAATIPSQGTTPASTSNCNCGASAGHKSRRCQCSRLEAPAQVQRRHRQYAEKAELNPDLENVISTATAQKNAALTKGQNVRTRAYPIRPKDRRTPRRAFLHRRTSAGGDMTDQRPSTTQQAINLSDLGKQSALEYAASLRAQYEADSRNPLPLHNKDHLGLQIYNHRIHNDNNKLLNQWQEGNPIVSLYSEPAAGSSSSNTNVSPENSATSAIDKALQNLRKAQKQVLKWAAEKGQGTETLSPAEAGVTKDQNVHLIPIAQNPAYLAADEAVIVKPTNPDSPEGTNFRLVHGVLTTIDTGDITYLNPSNSPISRDQVPATGKRTGYYKQLNPHARDPIAIQLAKQRVSDLNAEFYNAGIRRIALLNSDGHIEIKEEALGLTIPENASKWVKIQTA